MNGDAKALSEEDYLNTLRLVTKVPKEVNESASELKKSGVKGNASSETKTIDENTEHSTFKQEEGDPPSRILESNTSSLIPPWIKTSFGISEKNKGGTKPNQKALRSGYNDRNFHDSAELKTDPDNDCLSASYYIQESIASNSVFEVNIGNEADFPENSPRTCGKIKSMWKSRPGKPHQYECSIFAPYKDKRNPKSLKSEVASVDVVLPLEETYSSDDEKKKARQPKGKVKSLKKGSMGGEQKNEETFKAALEGAPCGNGRDVPDQGNETEIGVSEGVVSPDSRLLLACGKNKVDTLVEEDVSLSKEVKNQFDHKEGFDKLFQSMKENGVADVTPAKSCRDKGDKKEDKELDKTKREIIRLPRTDTESDKTVIYQREASLGPKNEEGETKSVNQYGARGKVIDEEKKYFEETVRHHEKKKWNQPRFVKLREEPRFQKSLEHETEAEREKKGFERTRMTPLRGKDNHGGEGNREKKTRIRHNSSVEKAVSETLQKFIELYRFQIPPEIVTGMKKSIVQTLQNECQESNNPKKNIENIDVLYAVQDLFRSKDMKKAEGLSLAVEDKEDKSKENGYRMGDSLIPTLKAPQDLSNPLGDGELIDKELLNDDEASIRSLLHVRDHRFSKENDVVENEQMKDLKKDFEKGLEFMNAQLDITGAKLCCIILEKSEVRDASKKTRIIHNFLTGTMESVKVCNDKVNIGSPEGDNVNTPTKMCDCQRDSGMEGFRVKMATRNQWSQTKDAPMHKQSTQTDCLNVSFKDKKHADMNPGLYRMTRAAELGRFYLYPVAVEKGPDAESPRPKNTASDVFELLDTNFLDKYDLFKESVLRSTSKETSVSDKGFCSSDKRCGHLRRKIKSDCLGLNNAKIRNGLRHRHSKNSLTNLVAHKVLTAKIKLGDVTVKRKDDYEEEEEEEEVVELDEMVNRSGAEHSKENPQLGKRKKAVKLESEDDRQEKEAATESGIHVGCAWLWNGKKIDPGVDLKVHVENLLREKLKEMLNEVKVEEDPRNEETSTDSSKDEVKEDTAEESTPVRDRGPEEKKDDKELLIKKAEICVTQGTNSPESPFVFSGALQYSAEGTEMQAGKKSKEALIWEPGIGFGKSVREVGTQNSRHIISPLNSSRTGKFAKQRCKKEYFLHKARYERSRNLGTVAKPSAFAMDVGAAKKVKLELNGSKENATTADEGGDCKSVRERYSVASNGSSAESSGDGQLRVKLIGIEVSKELDSPETEDKSFNNLEVKKFIVKDVPSRDKMEGAASDETSSGMKNKQWELIENVLNRVNQKEKEGLWNDVRDYVKRKIGRDINDEGAREVCIEIEQDVPKFGKGKSDHAVVAKGNYTRNEGDVEVEVDLTLDDLERILRHRQKKLRRRQYYENQKIKADSRKSSSSSATSGNDAFKFQSYAKTCSVFGDHYVNARNMKMAPEEN